MTVAVVSCVYGDTFHGFVPRWRRHVAALDPAADAVVVASDRPLQIDGAHVVVTDCPWRHPQAWHLNQAVAHADTDWVWFVDIDDCAFPDAVAGLGQVAADVWQVGYVRSDGRVTHIPAERHLPARGDGGESNQLTAGSCVRVEAFRRVGGFPDVAFQDWALWKKLQADGATFAFSGRPGYRYMRHLSTRSEVELLPKLRQQHVDEMEACLAA